jgi:ribosomal protein S18 acetylase RimI-like enzyme/O-methyltransferase involved in polyketide biosynthesis
MTMGDDHLEQQAELGVQSRKQAEPNAGQQQHWTKEDVDADVDDVDVDVDVDVAVVKTATDALHAKLSALVLGGYEPMNRNFSVYSHALHKVVETTMSSTPSSASSFKSGNNSLLKNVNSKKRKLLRRQTPLVNTGYAIRMGIMSNMMERFLKNSALVSSSRREVTIVQLGAGLDVAGIWALSVAKALGFVQATLIELDCPAICRKKKQLLEEIGMVQPHLAAEDHTTNTNSTTNTNNTVIHAYGIVPNDPWLITNKGKDDDNKSDSIDDNARTDTMNMSSFQANYVLAETNLDDITSVQHTWGQVTSLLSSQQQQQQDSPIIFVAELVLCYLRKGSADRLLSFVSSELLSGRPHSMLMCYEPLGGGDGDDDDHPTTSSGEILSSEVSNNDIKWKTFRQTYCDMFRCKLNKGRSTGTGSGSINHNSNSDIIQFHPVGGTTESAAHRFSKAGFEYSKALSAGHAALSCHMEVKAVEPFDEHAALALHLQCYGFAAGFSQGTSLHTALLIVSGEDVDLDIHRSTTTQAQAEAGLPSTITTTSNCLSLSPVCVTVTPMKKPFQEQTRDIFLATYQPYFQHHPPIRKMVKNALKQDLSVVSTRPTTHQLSNNGQEENNTSVVGIDIETDTSSIIRCRYLDLGGDFCVATISNTADEQRVVGFIGIRECLGVEEYKSSWQELADDDEAASESTPTPPRIFELKRFAVDPSCRGQGTGARLLQEAESIIKYKTFEEQRKRNIILAVTTAAVLKEASSFYKKHGFVLVQQEKDVCSIELNVFMKRL